MLFRQRRSKQNTVETTRGMIRLAQSQLNAINYELDVSKLSRKEVVDLTITLVNKVWYRRRDIINTSNRLDRALLNITPNNHEKVDRGILGHPTKGVSKNQNFLKSSELIIWDINKK